MEVITAVFAKGRHFVVSELFSPSQTPVIALSLAETREEPREIRRTDRMPDSQTEAFA